ncbi:hypothetical protein F4777DRAFT_542299 [Nemania sp. FL0916]|nr:hypothetical protein F4777DRAFT_542299 [Nemania sp. FL0916]
MAGRQVPGHAGVSQQAVLDAARVAMQFFEHRRERTFSAERIIVQGSVGVTIQMMMRSSGGEIPASGSSALLSWPFAWSAAWSWTT